MFRSPIRTNGRADELRAPCSYRRHAPWTVGRSCGWRFRVTQDRMEIACAAAHDRRATRRDLAGFAASIRWIEPAKPVGPRLATPTAAAATPATRARGSPRNGTLFARHTPRPFRRRTRPGSASRSRPGRSPSKSFEVARPQPRSLVWARELKRDGHQHAARRRNSPSHAGRTPRSGIVQRNTSPHARQRRSCAAPSHPRVA